MIDGLTRRHIDRHGEEVTIRNFTQTGTDEYGDPEFDETTATTKAIIRVPDKPIVRQTADGQSRTIELRVWVPDTVTINEPSDDTPKSSLIDRTMDDTTYEVQVKFLDDTGYIRCNCARYE